MPKILLVHPSDLFYGSGTAIIYRKLLSLLKEDFEIHHYISGWRSDDESNLKQRYSTELGITPHFAGFLKFRDFWGRLSRRWNQNIPDLRLPAWMDATAIKRVIDDLNPDIIWWSCDYLPLSSFALSKISPTHFQSRKLCLSLYDPPGFWNSGKWSFHASFKGSVARVDKIDVIGENMAKLVNSHRTDIIPIILNDYVETDPNPLPAAQGPFRIVITGQIYGGTQLQNLVDDLAELTSFTETEVHWFGTDQNLTVTKEIAWPSSVRLISRGLAERSQLPSLIANFHAGYLNMPEEKTGFGNYSVPTKLITYLEAGLPVVYHTSEEAEIHTMNLKYGFGINLELTDNIEAIAQNRTIFQSGGLSLIKERYLRKHVKQRLLNYLKG